MDKSQIDDKISEIMILKTQDLLLRFQNHCIYLKVLISKFRNIQVALSQIDDQKSEIMVLKTQELPFRFQNPLYLFKNLNYKIPKC